MLNIRTFVQHIVCRDFLKKYNQISLIKRKIRLPVSEQYWKKVHTPSTCSSYSKSKTIQLFISKTRQIR